MTISSDSDILTALVELETMINHGVSKVENLLRQAWDNESLKQIKEEISQARQELETVRATLQKSQNWSAQCVQELNSTSSRVLEQNILLEQVCKESENLYSKLKLEEGKAKDCLNSLIASMQEHQQQKTRLDEAIRRVETAENILSELDSKYSFLFEIKNNLVEIINRIDGYDSINDLVISIREATTRLQEEQVLAKTMIEELEPIKRKIDKLIQVQCIPWWWPSNWWWKTKNSFTVHRIRQFK